MRKAYHVNLMLRKRIIKVNFRYLYSNNSINARVMKKLIAFCTLCLVINFGFSQERKELKVNKDKSLVEAVYYHDNGSISQMGTYNLEGELHGKWMSFDEQGNKKSIGFFENGVKTGKWFFWSQDKLREVDFDNNTIASVQEWNNASQLVIRD